MSYLALPIVFKNMADRHQVSVIPYNAETFLVTLEDFMKIFDGEWAFLEKLHSKFQAKIHHASILLLCPLQQELVKTVSNEFYETFWHHQQLLQELSELFHINNMMIRDRYDNYIWLWAEIYIDFIIALRK